MLIPRGPNADWGSTSENLFLTTFICYNFFSSLWWEKMQRETRARNHRYFSPLQFNHFPWPLHHRNDGACWNFTIYFYVWTWAIWRHSRERSYDAFPPLRVCSPSLTLFLRRCASVCVCLVQCSIARTCVRASDNGFMSRLRHIGQTWLTVMRFCLSVAFMSWCHEIEMWKFSS